MNILDNVKAGYNHDKFEEYSIKEYLEICQKDKTAYGSVAERLLMAIGEPELIDTRHDPRLSRLFSNKIITR